MDLVVQITVKVTQVSRNQKIPDKYKNSIKRVLRISEANHEFTMTTPMLNVGSRPDRFCN
jgi:hypothetical protein